MIEASKEQLVVLLIEVEGLFALESVVPFQEPEIVVPALLYPMHVALDVKLPDPPGQIETPVVAGPAGFTTTEVVDIFEHPLYVAVKVNTPLFAVVAFDMLVDRDVELKLLGPVQLYVARGWLLVPFKVIVCPEQTGLLELVEIVGAVVEFIVTVVLDVETHPLYVAVNV